MEVFFHLPDPFENLSAIDSGKTISNIHPARFHVNVRQISHFNILYTVMETAFLIVNIHILPILYYQKSCSPALNVPAPCSGKKWGFELSKVPHKKIHFLKIPSPFLKKKLNALFISLFQKKTGNFFSRLVSIPRIHFHEQRQHLTGIRRGRTDSPNFAGIFPDRAIARKKPGTGNIYQTHAQPFIFICKSFLNLFLYFCISIKIF